MIIITKENIVDIANMYFEDVLEILMVTILFQIFTNKIDIQLAIKNSLILGIPFIILSYYNENIKTVVKNGLFSSMGANVLKKD